MVTLKQALKGKLTKKELSIAPSAFDMVGDIAIIEIPNELIKKEKLIAETLLNMLKNIKVVCKKADIHKGIFRTQKLKILAGEKRKETIHKENNVKIKLDIEKVYFSPRLSTERKRISKLVKPNESVLVMFSGSGIYPLVIARNSKPRIVYGIEINPTAYKYAEENVKLNKLEDKIKLLKGDVRKIMPKLNKKFDRILMPLPKGAESFLELALTASKKNTIIHFYDFLEENEFHKIKNKIKEACNKAKKKYRLIKIAKCGQFSPRISRVCADFKII